MSTFKDMAGWDNIFTGKYVSTIMHHTYAKNWFEHKSQQWSN